MVVEFVFILRSTSYIFHIPIYNYIYIYIYIYILVYFGNKLLLRQVSLKHR
jgi:hypothetical protein